MKATQRNNIEVKGIGEKAMIMAHGYGCDQNMWRYITPAFENDYKIVLFDHVGFGGSDVSGYSEDRYTSLKSYAKDVLEICEEMDLQDVVFVGHSVSAMIGVLAALQEPERFAKLILIAPSPKYINDDNYRGGFTEESINEMLEVLDSDYLGWSANMAPVIMGNPDKPELSAELTKSFCQSNEVVAKNFAKLTFLSDNREDVKRLQTEALILQCSDDVIAPLPVGEFLHQQIPNNTFVVMKATGHCPNLSAPDETVAAMKAFLKE
ncbi:alpha/beta fold hydrolase [Pontibacter sp. MBLB2868]|uniref:alpha/beta fold hydrolase n=1 Tax=Pontibacter sp. MBLB2868 TaxID=3451555 RepID=UPI003F74B182